jgi:hypothetical protein
MGSKKIQSSIYIQTFEEVLNTCKGRSTNSLRASEKNETVTGILLISSLELKP